MGWFLKFWIITSAASIAVVLVYALSIEAEVKRKYEILKKSNATFIEAIRALLVCFVPFINIITTLLILFNYEAALDSYVTTALLQNRIKEKA